MWPFASCAETFAAVAVAVFGAAAPGPCRPLAVPLEPGSKVLVVSADDLANGTYPLARPFVPVEGCPGPIGRP
jgi:hypothetical protein